jgi:hypothetical protein
MDDLYIDPWRNSKYNYCLSWIRVLRSTLYERTQMQTPPPLPTITKNVHFKLRSYSSGYLAWQVK